MLKRSDIPTSLWVKLTVCSFVTCLDVALSYYINLTEYHELNPLGDALLLSIGLHGFMAVRIITTFLAVLWFYILWQLQYKLTTQILSTIWTGEQLIVLIVLIM